MAAVCKSNPFAALKRRLPFKAFIHDDFYSAALAALTSSYVNIA